ncbi:substrate-binding periplasmic protein [Roseibium alexandrii]|uniref:substrate-binding periplasmic protein n=1 Tax=Roseibium alexandrii TaxID=388408 RepID=UPI0006E2176E|nr:transporter substrate-binding domain-containing protein [Roseibium alexandrii]
MLLTAFLMLAGGQGSAQAAERCDTIRVNGTVDWYPVIMRSSDTGLASGVLPATMVELGRRVGIDVIFQPITPFKRQLVQLENGSLDAVLGAYWTKERAEKFQYSSSVLDDEVAIFVLKGKEFPLSKRSDLVGRLGIRPFGGSYGEDFDQYAREHLAMQEIAPVPTDFRRDMLAMLLNENADYAVLGRFHGLKIIEEGEGADQLIDLEWPVVSNGVHILFSRKSPCAHLFDRFEEQLKKLWAEGWIESVLADYRRPGQ